MTLVRMKPRGGRRIGLLGRDEETGLLDALTQLPPAERSKIVGGMVPQLVQGMTAPVPAAKPGEPPPPDPSFADKDASFALLTHEGGTLIGSDDSRKKIREGLAQWSSTNFAVRMDDSSQAFGLEQVVRELKAEGARPLPDLIAPGAPKIDRVADLIADLGDEETKLRAANKLVEVARQVDSQAWIDVRAPSVEAANKVAKLAPTPEQFNAQLKQFQEEELLRIFGSMKRVGGAPIVAYLLEFAKNKDAAPKRRAAALAALEGNINRNDAHQADALLTLTSDDATPDEVRDIALRRVGEMPRSIVVARLYNLFENKNWKVRWVAAELCLKMTTDESQLAEFMSKIGAADNMSLTEPLRYGALLGAIKGPTPPSELAVRYARPGNNVQARLSALGYFYEFGTPADLAKVSPYADDKTKVPECEKDAQECEWKCAVGEESKDITTVGQFVEYCVKPAMQKRDTASSKSGTSDGK
jgi:hypothetical protein